MASQSKFSLPNLLLRWAVLALGVMLATNLVNGIRCDDGATLVKVVLLLSLFNAVLRPLLLLFTLPFILLTMGLGVLVINAMLFLWVGSGMVAGFHVAGFWPALWGALIVSLTNMVAGGLFRGPPRPPRRGPPASPAGGGGDVIDI
ncbi:MAG: phage holin family protein [Verrucomicrobiota bacterium]